MNIEIRNPVRVSKVDVWLYNRGDCLGIDFNNCKSQILLTEVTAAQARAMIGELERYIQGLPPKFKNTEVDTELPIIDELLTTKTK